MRDGGIDLNVLLSNWCVISLDTQLSAVDSLIDSMMLVEENENEEQVDMFKVHQLPNPAFQRHFQVLQHSLYFRHITLLLWVGADGKSQKLKKLSSALLEIHQIPVDTKPEWILSQSPSNPSILLHPIFLSVSTSSSSKPRYPSSPHGAVAEGCSWAPWGH